MGVGHLTSALDADEEPSRRSGRAVAAPAFWEAPLRSSLFVGGREITADHLDALVASRAEEIGPGRLVLLQGANDVEFVVSLLACLRAGSPVIVSGSAGSTAPLVEKFDPDVVVDPMSDGPRVQHRRTDAAHDLHPDLALLLSTSGSTGSPRLVRLSRQNVATNAVAIAEYLRLGPEDRAVTSLPLHYCYGLSVLTSHLVAGAAVVLTDLSVVDRCFWSLVEGMGVTTIAGVPYTFDLLDRTGFAESPPPSLRRLTQAGGAMAPDTVRRYARLGREHGFDLYVMYGQTEATARMAYLPPELAEEHPTSVGVAIPGGELRIDPLPSEEATGWPRRSGEVVYRGPNVMMGYASSAAELAGGPQLTELRTGDIGHLDGEGLLHLEGRRSRFAKICGLRIDLDHVERTLAARGVHALCVGDDERLVVGVVAGSDGVDAAAGAAVREVVDLPLRRLAVVALDQEPRLPSGKVDRSAVLAAATEMDTPSAASSVGAVLAAATGARSVGPTDTFVSLGGDSLSYVEASVMLEEHVHPLPESWHLMTVADLEAVAASGRRSSRRWVHLDTGLVLRAAAVVLIVGNHMDVFTILGSAHVLLAAAGFNMSRFLLSDPVGDHHVRRWGTAVGRVALPAVLWIGIGLFFLDRYTTGALLQVNNWIGEPTPERMAWRYWFIEVLVQCLVIAGIVFAVPAVRRLERRYPFAFALSVSVALTLVRFAPFEPDRLYWYRTGRVAWVFALGWAAHRARTVPQRLVVTALAAVGSWGFFSIELRNAILLGGIVLLVWVGTVPVPSASRRLVGAMAASSLAIYLIHGDVYPVVQRYVPVPPVALLVTLALCLAIARTSSAAWRHSVAFVGARGDQLSVDGLGMKAAAAVAVTRTRVPGVRHSRS
ncbi:AMP-binding protein [Dermatobacter hominis]|uniref:AMP-binding protein n=1 Tax=Dermatobacter hominis TaxID=2884263 RepID=UPI001D129BB4|nr:AMP-binding protein [Dermatobacter hominis]UDY36099.1 AMP-binding protein [Dermatobacter hominis]